MNRVNHGASGEGWVGSAWGRRYLDLLAAVGLVGAERGVPPALGVPDLLVLRGWRRT